MNKSIYRTGMRTNLCGEIKKEFVGKDILLCGWVNKRRDHGNLIFVDLRDFSGLVQLVFDPNAYKEAHKMAKDVRGEYVLRIEGRVRERSKEAINPELPTGEIEVVVLRIEVLARSKTLPFMLEHRDRVEENTRLKYRYIDLRTEQMQKNMRLRHNVASITRDYFNSNGFIEVETPILAKSTPEGARDFLVPSRVNPGKFYALPQSPQLFKQVLMFSGFDRCYQIARCFRDEDLRADRQPEFTQIDLEMTFVEADDVMEIIEGLFFNIFKEVLGIKIKLPFERMSWKESMERFGTDKPDLRFGLEMADISHIFKESHLKIFQNVLKNKGCIKGLVVDDSSGFSRKELDDIVDIAKKSGAGGLIWIKIEKNMEFKSPVTKFLSDGEIKGLTKDLSLKEGNLLLIVADEFVKACKALGTVRSHLGQKLKSIGKDKYRFVWINDFPLFEWNEEEKRYSSMHHPFTRPDEETIKYLDSDPSKVNSLAYDIVLNGEEIGGGSIRISSEELQRKIFKLLEIEEEMINKNFGFFVEALNYGAPPHGGIALGMDRLVMIMGNLSSIREVIAFPKTQSAICLMTGSPTPVSSEQLKEVSLELTEEDE